MPKKPKKVTMTQKQKIAYNRYSGRMVLKGKSPLKRGVWLKTMYAPVKGKKRK